MLKAKIKELMKTRIEKGFNKTDLAREANINHSIISRIERGSIVSPRSAKRISQALNVEIFSIFEIVGVK